MFDDNMLFHLKFGHKGTLFYCVNRRIINIQLKKNTSTNIIFSKKKPICNTYSENKA